MKQLVAQIEFTEWTPDGHLRQSKFVDKAARALCGRNTDYYSPALKS